MPNIVIISGSPAEVSRTSALASFLNNVIAEQGHQVNKISVRDLPSEALIYAQFNNSAIKEAQEETGIKKVLPIKSDVFSLDVLHVIPHVKKGRYISAHLHLNITYLLEADEKERLMVKEDENSGVKWIPIEEVNNYSNEPHMKKVYGKLIDKIKAIRN